MVPSPSSWLTQWKSHSAHLLWHVLRQHIHSFAIGCLESRVGALLMDFEIGSRFKTLFIGLNDNLGQLGNLLLVLVSVRPGKIQTGNAFMR